MPKPRYKIWMTEPKPHRLGASLLRFLRRHFDIVLDAEEPDLVFFTRDALEAGYLLRPRVFFDAQQSPVWSEPLMDWDLGYVPPDAAAWQHYMPNWLFLDCARLAAPPEDAQQLMRAKRRFCILVHRLIKSVRSGFYELLSAQRRVDSLGDMLRNRPPPPGLGSPFHPERYNQLPPIYRAYKFVICFENISHPGYLSEKLINALLARSVPIYWGDPLVTERIHPASFINAHDFATPQSLVEHVLKVDADDALYRQYLSAPIFRDQRLPDCARWDGLRAQLGAWLQQSRAQDFQPQGQKALFLREHVSRLAPHYLRTFFPVKIDKSIQVWSDPHQALRARAQQAADGRAL